MLDPVTHELQVGLSCRGCYIAKQESYLARRRWSSRYACTRLFSKEEYLKHFVCCRDSVQLWNRSGQGSPKAPDMVDLLPRHIVFLPGSFYDEV